MDLMTFFAALDVWDYVIFILVVTVVVSTGMYYWRRHTDRVETDYDEMELFGDYPDIPSITRRDRKQ